MILLLSLPQQSGSQILLPCAPTAPHILSMDAEQSSKFLLVFFAGQSSVYLAHGYISRTQFNAWHIVGFNEQFLKE